MPDAESIVPPAADRAAHALRRLAGGKTARDENFPVASRLLAARVRPAVMRFYRFARAADDIADSPLLPPEAKLAALDAADAALRGAPGEVPEPLRDATVVGAAWELRALCEEAALPVLHARHLLQAFRKDAVQSRYDTWSDLLAYCNFSAAPVGRFLLALHGEDRSAAPPADALCNAHQLLNHVQDCKADFRRLDRVYLPVRWMREEGAAVEMLGDAAAHPALRRVLDRTLAGAAQLLDAARPLPRLLRDRRLRAQAAATLAMGDLLLRRLRRQDPLRNRVRLGAAAKARCLAAGLAHAWSPAANG